MTNPAARPPARFARCVKSRYRAACWSVLAPSPHTSIPHSLHDLTVLISLVISRFWFLSELNFHFSLLSWVGGWENYFQFRACFFLSFRWSVRTEFPLHVRAMVLACLLTPPAVILTSRGCVPLISRSIFPPCPKGANRPWSTKVSIRCYLDQGPCVLIVHSFILLLMHPLT